MAESNRMESRISEFNSEGRAPESREMKWDMPLDELYILALHFYKEKSGKAIHLSYEDNLKLVAFTQQTSNGPFDAKNSPPLGVLDVIGKDRRSAWHHLGAMTKQQAMEGFIDLLDHICPSFKPYVEAVRRDKEERLRLEVEEQRQLKENLEKERVQQEELKEREEIRNKEEMQRRQLQDALNQQTFNQFKAYAEKQFPRNPEQQAILIRQLQNEHYNQYMQQLHAHAQVRSNNRDSAEKYSLDDRPKGTTNDNCGDMSENDEANDNCIFHDSDKSKADIEEYSNEYGNLIPAKMWTRPDIKLFKEEVSIGNGDGIINVGHGDTVTVRVPTFESGNSIFWEFATDDYDIGFGVYFEWGKSMSNEVTVHVSESDDDEEIYEDDDDAEFSTVRDLECGPVSAGRSSTIVQSRPPISIIVPLYRRECQREVYVGSHNYPGEGVYLLKFDNSFSIWRSKTLYYKVYYER